MSETENAMLGIEGAYQQKMKNKNEVECRCERIIWKILWVEIKEWNYSRVMELLILVRGVDHFSTSGNG